MFDVSHLIYYLYLATTHTSQQRSCGVDSQHDTAGALRATATSVLISRSLLVWAAV
jgi:hypothetical protein